MVATAFAAVKVVLALVGVPALLGREPVPRGAVPFALNLIIFGVGGLLLVGGTIAIGGLRLLGGLYLTTAAAFVQPFLTHRRCRRHADGRVADRRRRSVPAAGRVALRVEPSARAARPPGALAGRA